MDERTTVHVPVSLVTHCLTLEPGYQLPLTVTPPNRLCLASWTVIVTVADQTSPVVAATPSRLPTCMLGGFTAMPMARALLLALAPAASPTTVSVPTTGPLAPPSVRATSKFVVTS